MQGVIKLLHVPWNWAKPIVAFKQGAQLPIGFCQTLSRPQYELLAQERWFSYFAIGAVEPFADTAYGVASLAKYLEDYDVAGVSRLRTQTHRVANRKYSFGTTQKMILRSSYTPAEARHGKTLVRNLFDMANRAYTLRSVVSFKSQDLSLRP